MRSSWRGDARNTSMPNRARSLCAAPVAIISIAQHARPNEAGHIDLVRAQLTALASLAVRKLEGTAARGINEPSCNVALSGTKGRRPRIASRRLLGDAVLDYPTVSGAVGDIPVEGAAFPHIDQRLSEKQSEDADGPDAVPAEFGEPHCPGEEEHDLDVEDHEQHRHQVELHGEALHRLLKRDDAALVRVEFLRSRVVRGDEPAETK